MKTLLLLVGLIAGYCLGLMSLNNVPPVQAAQAHCEGIGYLNFFEVTYEGERICYDPYLFTYGQNMGEIECSENDLEKE